MFSDSTSNVHRPDHRIARVWVEPGCRLHDLCVELCPEVFVLENDENNEEKIESVKLLSEAKNHYESHQKQIEDAAYACPVSVIRIQYDDGAIFDGDELKMPDTKPQ